MTQNDDHELNVKKEEKLSFQLLDWFSWKILVPLLLILSFWPIYGFILGLEHPFSKACSPGELLIFSAVILIGAAGESEPFETHNWRLGALRRAALLLGLVLVLSLGPVKFDAVNKERLLFGNDKQQELLAAGRLTEYSVFACIVAVFSISISFFTFCASLNHKNRERLNAVSQEVP